MTNPLLRALKPPPRLKISEWADKYRVLSGESSSEKGLWKTDRAEYQREIMDACCDLDTHTVVFKASAQVGKTEMLNNIIGYYVDSDPCPILCVQPNVELAETWSKDRITPMFRDTPRLHGKIGDVSKRSNGNTIRKKKFTGGSLTFVGSESPSGLASRPIRLVLMDEVDRYPESAGSEGDPVDLVRKRTRTFWNRKIILTSTPTDENSRIEKEFLNSDQRHLYVPCPQCGHYQTLVWANLTFDKKNVEDAIFTCVKNGCVIREKDKPKMLKKSEFRPHAEFNGTAGFFVSEFYSPWSTWSTIAEEFLKTKGNTNNLKVWINTSLGEIFKQLPETSHLQLQENIGNYDKDTLDADILFITAGVDIQKDRIEALSQGWGADYEHWDIEHKVFWGDPAREKKVWDELDEWIKQVYNVGQHKMRARCVLVDSGYLSTQVYSFCKTKHKRGVFPSKGSSLYSQQIVTPPKQLSKQRVMHVTVGTDTAKDTIITSWMRVRPTDESREGLMHFPIGTPDEYLKQLASETSVLKNGRRVWKKTRERNEMIDLHVLCLAGYHLVDPNIDKMVAARLAPAIDETKEDQKPAPKRPKQLRRSGKKRGFATNF